MFNISWGKFVSESSRRLTVPQWYQKRNKCRLSTLVCFIYLHTTASKIAWQIPAQTHLPFSPGRKQLVTFWPLLLFEASLATRNKESRWQRLRNLFHHHTYIGSPCWSKKSPRTHDTFNCRSPSTLDLTILVGQALLAHVMVLEANSFTRFLVHKQFWTASKTHLQHTSSHFLRRKRPGPAPIFIRWCDLMKAVPASNMHKKNTFLFQDALRFVSIQYPPQAIRTLLGSSAYLDFSRHHTRGKAMPFRLGLSFTSCYQHGIFLG